MLLSIKVIVKFLSALTFVGIVAGCNPLSNQSKSTKNDANITLNEKPEILDISTSVIWNGEKTLGGNWISHPDVDIPEKVIIKNVSNGKSIVGAIFQQTKKMEIGSAIISSDAAIALGIAHNEQTKVQIVAVRVSESTAPTNNIDEINAQNSDVIGKKLSKPFIQVGIFSVENNADKTKDQMLELNLPVNIFEFQIKGKPYWRVVAGPASTSDSRKNMLKVIKSAAFIDAYYVSN